MEVDIDRDVRKVTVDFYDPEHWAPEELTEPRWSKELVIKAIVKRRSM